MKVKNILAMATIALLAVACSDDDDAVNVGTKVEGTYKGELIMFKGDPSDAAVKLESQSNGNLTIVLPQAGMGSMQLPEMTVKDIKISETTANEYVFSMPANDSIIIKANGMDIITKGLSGSVKNDKVTLTYQVKPGKMPMYIPAEFEGAKK